MKLARLQEITTQITDGKHGDCNNEENSGYYFVSCKDVYDGSIHYEQSRQITRDDCDDVRRRIALEPGDSVITNSGTIGRMAFATDRLETYRTAFQKSVAVVKPRKDIVEPEYLYYLLLSCVSDMARNSNGSAQKNLLLSTMREYELSFHESKDIQRRLVEIISAYDNLIENNRRQIALLEEAAQRLFKEWFVDLRFPGHEDTEIVDRIPDGWQIVQIRDVCKKIQSGGTPSRKKASFWDPGTVKWFKTGELQDCWLIEPEELISDDGLAGSAAKLFPPLTIVMAIYASPTLGRLGILNCEAAFNQAMLGFIVNEDVTTRDWLYWKLFELRIEFNLIARGAGQQNISGEIVKSYEVLLPPRVLAQKFSDVVGPMAERRLKLQEQNLTVSEARDRLLPKLMSGEVEVGNFADDVCKIPNSAVSIA